MNMIKYKLKVAGSILFGAGLAVFGIILFDMAMAYMQAG
jgi:hypothetical protein